MKIIPFRFLLLSFLFSLFSIVTNAATSEDCSILTDPILEFSAVSVAVNEGAGTITVQVNITNSSPNPTSVQVGLFGGTATSGIDFTFTNPTTITFPANSTTPQTVNVQIIDDTDIESSEHLILGMYGQNNNATFGSDSITYVIIQDNDVFVRPILEFDTSSIIVNEDVGTVTLAVNILNQNANPTTAKVGLLGGDAVLGTDFNYTNPTTITFPANSSTPQTVTLTIIDDAIIENTETILLGVYNGSNSGTWTTYGADSILLVTINDNDAVNTTQILEDNVRFMPNPANDIIYVTTTIDIQTIQLINALGQVIENIPHPARQQLINVAQLPNGIYFIRFTNKNNRMTKKLVIKH